MVKMWGLFLLIFNFNTATWDNAPIRGAVWFEKQQTCVEVMAEYNRMLEMTNTAFRFICEPQEWPVPGTNESNDLNEEKIVPSGPELEA